MLKPSSPAPEPLHSTTKANVGQENAPSPHTITTKPTMAQSEESSTNSLKLKIPTVRLEGKEISSAMAARLATSLLCHVLFLKSQIPFPVVQLSRMPGAQSDSRAVKRREELSTAVDMLGSHLQTTFTALSTAFAQREKRLSPAGGFVTEEPSNARAYLAYVLGPSVGSAKARVVLAVDGLEVKAWEARSSEDSIVSAQECGDSEEDHESCHDDEDDEDDSESDSSEEESASDEEETQDDESSTPPPPSRSPSPSPPASPSVSPGRPLSPPRTARAPLAIVPLTDRPAFKIFQSSSPTTSENTPPAGIPLSSKVTSPRPSLGTSLPKSNPLAPSSRVLSENAAPAPRRSLGGGKPLAPLSPSQKPVLQQRTTPAPTHAEEQQVLRAADRLLSRTLANACAEADGGLTAEMTPTQTHVLLRAPRCFSHPAWTPRQNLTRTLESQLQAFLDDIVDDSTADASADAPKKKPQRFGVKTEGVWISCAGGSREAREDLSQNASEREEDEMIWWAWDGKIVGFNDW